jgi:hypothetical protein
LAIVLFHNVFPERTFPLEHFYLPLYYFSSYPDFDIKLFMSFCEDNHLIMAVKANLSLVAYLHQYLFNTIPSPVQLVLDKWGIDTFEQKRFTKKGRQTPYLFSPRLFWLSFAGKLVEWYSLRTALIQLWNLRDPKFLLEVIHTIRNRLGSESVYKLE